METTDQGWGAGLKTALIALPILYILSIGPVYLSVWMAGSGLPPQVYTVIEILYQPLLLLHEHTALRGPLEAYLNWWFEFRR